MTFLKSLPENAVLLNVFKAYPGPARELIEYHEVVLRGPSPLAPPSANSSPPSSRRSTVAAIAGACIPPPRKSWASPPAPWTP